jgi:ABC-2 type transport system ATP-binding protein
MNALPRQLEATGPTAVRTERLAKRYGRTVALDGVDITVPAGSVYVLLGPNGVGKTTLLKVLLDLVVADSGRAAVFGVDTHRDAALAKAQIGYVPERDVVAYDWARVDDLLRYHASFFRGWDAVYATELARFFDVRADARMGTLSKGQQRRVQLLLALAHRPPLLVLDEPMDGLDPLMRDRTAVAIADHLARFETTILMSTHQVQETDRLCDHVCVLSAGAVQAQLSRESLRRGLRRYTLEPPPLWAATPALDGAVLQREGGAREAAWTIWGEERDVVDRLRAAGAVVHRVEPLTLHDAAVVLLASAVVGGSAGDDALAAVAHQTQHAGV